MKRIYTILIFLLIPLYAYAGDADAALSHIRQVIPRLSSSDAVSADGHTYEFRLDGGSATVTVDENNAVINYMYSVPERTAEKKLPAVTKTQAAQAALDFARLAAADIFPQLDTQVFTNTYSSAAPAGFSLRFTQIAHGIPYSGNNISLWVNAQTGEVTHFARVWNSGIIFAPIDGIISRDDATDQFFSNIGLELRYNKKIVKGEVTPYQVFVPATTEVIDAATGEAVLTAMPTVGDGYAEMLSLYERTSVSTTDLSENPGIVSGTTAQEAARLIDEIGIDSEYSARLVNYHKNTNNEYLVTVEFEKPGGNISVTLDGSTLAPIGFYNSERAAKKNELPLDRAKAEAAAAVFMEKHLSKYKGQFTAPQVIAVDNSDIAACAVIYERHIDGVVYKSNGAQFLISSDSKVISFSFVWDEAFFEQSENAPDFAAAEEIFKNKIGLNLTHMRTADGLVRLVYTVNPQVSAIIDANNGELLSYDGTVAMPRKSLSYLNLDGHYAQNQASALAEIDIFVSEGNVDLDEFISQKDFIVLLASISPENMPVYQKQGGFSNEDLDMIYGAFSAQGVLDKSEVNYDEFISRQVAVKYLLRMAGYKDVAELEGIFKRHFNDSDFIDPELYGYVSLARGLNLIRGSYGYFYPEASLSNGDALIMVYNYLNRG